MFPKLPSPKGGKQAKKAEITVRAQPTDHDMDQDEESTNEAAGDPAEQYHTPGQSMEDEQDTTEAPALKDIHPMESTKVIDEFLIPAVAGKSHKAKVNNLLHDMQDQVSIIGKLRVCHRQIGKNTEKFLAIRVGEPKHKERLATLMYKDITPEDATSVCFERFTEVQEANDRARQVDVRSLKPNTTQEAIRGAFKLWGDVEYIRVWPRPPGRETGRSPSLYSLIRSNL